LTSPEAGSHARAALRSWLVVGLIGVGIVLRVATFLENPPLGLVDRSILNPSSLVAVQLHFRMSVPVAVGTVTLNDVGAGGMPVGFSVVIETVTGALFEPPSFTRKVKKSAPAEPALGV